MGSVSGRSNRGFPWLWSVRLLVLLLVSLVFSGKAEAHKVIVFAWVDGDIVHTESKFPSGKMVSFGKISVLDRKGTTLLTGETDEKGYFSFTAPSAAPLTVVLKAGQGHGSSWKITEEDLGREKKESAEEEAAAGMLPADSSPEGESGGLREGNIRAFEAIVEKIVERELAPVKRMLAEQSEKKVSVNDIFGGIGYILGLMGVGIYVNNRSKQKGDEKR